jgi:hypothetical protein
MLTRTPITIAALAVTSLALTVAGPASAISRDLGPGGELPTIERTVDYPPVGTKWCTIEVTGVDGKKTTISVPPGSKMKINGKEYECQDGRWEGTAPMDFVGTAGDYVFEADRAWADWEGSIVEVDLQAELSP